MKKTIYPLQILVCICLTYSFVFCQNTEQKINTKIYKTWVLPLDNTRKISGYLLQASDSLILVTDPLNKKVLRKDNIPYDDNYINAMQSNYATRGIPLHNVQEVKFRSADATGKGALIGGIAGFVVGGVIGYSTAEGCKGTFFEICVDKEVTGLLTGIASVIPGVVIGAAFSSGKMKIPINGNTSDREAEFKKYMLSY